MEKIAEVTGGMYVMVQDMNELSTFFKRQVLLSRFIAKFAHGEFLNFHSQPRAIVVLQVIARNKPDTNFKMHLKYHEMSPCTLIQLQYRLHNLAV